MYTHINAVESLLEATTNDSIHLTSLLRTNSVVPTVPWQCNFTSLRGQPLCNSKITVGVVHLANIKFGNLTANSN